MWGRDDERPQHEVTIAKPFAVGKFGVTFAQWDQCTAAGACPRALDHWARKDQPVINVSWDDAKQYVAWLSRVSGKPYRLLTEAEWEYAAWQAPPQIIPGVTRSAKETPTALGVEVVGAVGLRQSDRSNPVPLVSMICTATCGNGPRTGIATATGEPRVMGAR